LDVNVNVVFEHLLDSQKKIVVEQGGTRSGKTYNILLFIIFHYCQVNTGKTITICRKTFPALRSSVMRDFIDILKIHNKYAEGNHNKSNSEYDLNGNLVEFISVDQPQKIRGRKREFLFINEANELDYEDWQQLVFRTTEKIVIDFNPSDFYHWIYDKVIPREDVEFFKTTYLDNKFLDTSIIEEIERLKQTDEHYWRIYGLGQRGYSKATIFKYYETDNIPADAELVSYGLDYGYTNDPTAMVGVWKKDYELYIKECIYQTMMTGRDIHHKLKDLGINKELIYADSAEPRLNEELRRMGWNIRPSVKGKDSINAGIDLLKRYKLNITKDSHHAIQEFRDYKWKEDKSGKLTNQPEPKNDHLIDATRYSTYSIMSKVNFGKYAIR
jgi:phage terminase large subunit